MAFKAVRGISSRDAVVLATLPVSRKALHYFEWSRLRSI